MRGVAETSGAWSDQTATANHGFNVTTITCVGLRKHRARGRICPHKDATNGRIGRLYLAFKTKAITLLLLVAHILAT